MALIGSGVYNCTTDYEVSLLRLLEKITNGTVIEISYTGPWSHSLLHTELRLKYCQGHLCLSNPA